MAKTLACPSNLKIDPIGIGLVQQHAGIVDQVAGLEVVRTVGDDVVLRKNLKRIGASQHGVVLEDIQCGIERVQLLLRRIDLLAANIPWSSE